MPSKDNEAYHRGDEDATDEFENVRSRSQLEKSGFGTQYNENGPNVAKGLAKDDGLEVVAFEEQVQEPPKLSWGELWRTYPKRVILIFGNEFCERFSYYGMKAVLVLYLVNVLKFSQNDATSLNSGFAILCYFSPLLGSILADGYIGKYHTIMWVSLFYAAGNIILAVAASIGDSVHPWLDFIGLIVIGLGTGGIKPCVQPFGADQFVKGQEKQLQQFFSIFYFAINAGSTISIVVTPLFRVTPCLNQTTCYPLSFGVPAALMVVAVIFFALGTPFYKRFPPKGNIFSKTARTIGTALKNKTTFDVKRDHWMDHYMDSHNCSYDDECRAAGKCKKIAFVEDIKALFRILVVFVPLPIFWALYDQQSSTWVFQAAEMNYQISKGVFFLPDQMGVMNSVMIMVLIPIFTLIIYPLANKCVKVTPLRKMCVGCFLAGVAYLVCMGIQINIRPTLPALPDSGNTLVSAYNYIQQCGDTKLQFVARDETNKTVFSQTLGNGEFGTFQAKSKSLTWDVAGDCAWVQRHKADLNAQNTAVSANEVGYTIFTDDLPNLKLHPTNTQKSQSGEAVYTMNVNYYASFGQANVSVAFCKNAETHNDCHKSDAENYIKFDIDEDRTSSYNDVKVNEKWTIFIVTGDGDGDYIDPKLPQQTYEEMGGIWTLTILNPDPADPKNFTMFFQRQAPDNSYSILWQVPQYFVISVAEVLFSITGYELAYSQAPLSMKSIVFSLYLITDAIGNVIILIITAAANFGQDLTWAFLAYACLMFFITVVFIFISMRYKYTIYIRGEDDDEDDK